MSELKYCQGPDCHTYDTKDRLKGQKGNKTYQTRRRTSMYYGGGNFCSTRCQDDWFRQYGTQAVNHFGRTIAPKKLTEDNAWYKDYDYNWRDEGDSQSNWRSVNKITREQRPMTKEQYNDDAYTLNQ